MFRRILSPGNPVPLPQGPASKAFKYGGCFVASTFVAAAEANGLVLPNSDVDACSAAATAKGLKYLGLQGSTCYAADTPPISSHEAGIGLCANPCPGKPSEACGGAIDSGEALLRKRQDTTAAAAGTEPLITLFEAAAPTPVTAAPTPDTAANGPTGPDGSFVEGCFDAGASIGDAYAYGQVFLSPSSGLNSNGGSECVAACDALNQGYQYAFTQYNACYCSNIPPTTPATDQSSCDETCYNNPTEVCGGQDLTNPDGGIFVNLYSGLSTAQVRPIISFVGRTHTQCSVAHCSLLWKISVLER